MWLNGRLDTLIERQGFHSQQHDEEEDMLWLDANEEDKNGCGNDQHNQVLQSHNYDCQSEDHLTVRAPDNGAHHHIHMRTMATVSSDPVEWMYSDKETPPLKRDLHVTNEPCESITLDNFARSCCPRQVAKFVKSACRSLFPLDGVWRSKRASSSRLNYNLFMKRIEEYVCLGRWESVNASQLCHGMKSSMIPWLSCGSVGRNKSECEYEMEVKFCCDAVVFVKSW